MTLTAAEALRAGKIDDAIAIATAAVKAAPTDADARWLMAELLLLSGDVERADRMLDAAALREPNPAVLEFRKLLRAEVIRSQVVRDGRPPVYQGQTATGAQMVAMRARVLLRTGDTAAAVEAAAEIEAVRPRIPGRHEQADGSVLAFEDLRDLDDLFACELEILTTAGDYMLAPWERIARLAFDAPRRPRDLAWRRCEIDLKDGTNGIVFLPALYPGSSAEPTAAIRMGRETEWSMPQDGPIRGRGQRVMLVGDDAVAFTALHVLEFA